MPGDSEVSSQIVPLTAVLCVLQAGTFNHRPGTADLWTGKDKGTSPRVPSVTAMARQAKEICSSPKCLWKAIFSPEIPLH